MSKVEDLICWECLNTVNSHKLSCDSRYITSNYRYVIDNLHRLPAQYLDRLSFEIYVEQRERLNALEEISKLGQEMGEYK
ncbi:hypothetical protein D3C85_1191370 [compost metagenome]